MSETPADKNQVPDPSKREAIKQGITYVAGALLSSTLGPKLFSEAEKASRLEAARARLEVATGLSTTLNFTDSHDPNLTDPNHTVLTGEINLFRWFTKDADTAENKGRREQGIEYASWQDIENTRKIAAEVPYILFTGQDIDFFAPAAAGTIARKDDIEAFLKYISTYGVGVFSPLFMPGESYSRRQLLGGVLTSVFGAFVENKQRTSRNYEADITKLDSYDPMARELISVVLPLRESTVEARNMATVLDNLAAAPVLRNLQPEGLNLHFHAARGHFGATDEILKNPRDLENEYSQLVRGKLKAMVDKVSEMRLKILEGNDQNKLSELRKVAAITFAGYIHMVTGPCALGVNRNKAELTLEEIRQMPIVQTNEPLSSIVLVTKQLKSFEEELENMPEDERSYFRNIFLATMAYVSDDFTKDGLPYTFNEEEQKEMGFLISPDNGQQEDLEVFGVKIRHAHGLVSQITKMA